MKNNKKQKEEALIIFKAQTFTAVNNGLFDKYGHSTAMYISNLVDKYFYFKKVGKLQKDGSFFLTHEQQMKQIGMSLHMLQKSKKQLKDEGVLTTKMKGMPPKEFYDIDVVSLVEAMSSPFHLQDRGIINGKTEDQSSVKPTNINYPKYNKNKTTTMVEDVKKPFKRTKSSKNKVDPVIPNKSKILPKHITLDQFDNIWKLYPSNKAKGPAYTAWDNWCKKPIKDRPLMKRIR